MKQTADTRGKREIFNSKIVQRTRSAINSDMWKDRDKEKGKNLLFLSLNVSIGNQNSHFQTSVINIEEVIGP